MSIDPQTESSQLWASLLKSAGNVTAPPSAALLLLGPGEQAQRQLISRIQKKSQDSTSPNIANKFGLGYTYVDFKDDNDDKLSHLDIYTLEIGSLEHSSDSDAETEEEEEDANSTLPESERNDESEVIESEANPRPIAGSVDSTRSPFLQKHSNTIQYINQVLSRIESKKQRLLVGIAFDWNEDVKLWARNLRDWIEILRASIRAFDNEVTVNELQQRLQTYSAPRGSGMSGHVPVSLSTAASTDTSVNSKDESKVTSVSAESVYGTSSSSVPDIPLPLEKGQYDSPLGLDLLIVTIGSEKLASTSILSSSSTNTQRYSEDTVDFIQQFLRTIALKHGGSVVYVPYSLDIPLEGLVDIISERLQIPIAVKQSKPGFATSSLVQRAIPNVIDSDKLVVPAGWDSQGKILAVRDGFMIDEISNNWMSMKKNNLGIKVFESVISTDLPSSPTKQAKSTTQVNFQEVLKSHYLAAKSESAVGAAASPQTPIRRGTLGNVSSNVIHANSGIGGIQLESVEEMVRRLKDREAAVVNSPITPDRSGEISESTTPSSANQNKVLANFFQHLLTKHKTSPGGSDEI